MPDWALNKGRKVMPKLATVRLGIPRVLWIAWVVLGLVLVASAGAGASAQQIVCGSTLTSDTTLTSDLYCPYSPETAIALTLAQGVTLDMNGHTLSGSGNGRGIGGESTNGQGASFTVKNGTITGFAAGIGGGATASRVRLISNLRGAEAIDGGVAITDSVLSHNGTGVAGTSGGITISHSTVSNNGNGISAFQGGITAVGDVITDNDNDGIHIVFGIITVSDSAVSGNGGFGIFVFSSQQDPRATLTGNVTSRNGADGIYLAQLGPISVPNVWYVSHNVADRNHNYGIEVDNLGGAISGYDGGGNVARGNGQPQQCLNIACARN
jgi:hypothetical protein